MRLTQDASCPSGANDRAPPACREHGDSLRTGVAGYTRLPPQRIRIPQKIRAGDAGGSDAIVPRMKYLAFLRVIHSGGPERFHARRRQPRPTNPHLPFVAPCTNWPNFGGLVFSAILNRLFTTHPGLQRSFRTARGLPRPSSAGPSPELQTWEHGSLHAGVCNYGNYR